MYDVNFVAAGVELTLYHLILSFYDFEECILLKNVGKVENAGKPGFSPTPTFSNFLLANQIFLTKLNQL